MQQPRPTVGIQRIVDVDRQIANDEMRWRGFYAALMIGALAFGLLAYTSAPKALPIAFLLLFMACAAAFLRPTIGVYLIVFWTLVGDAATMPWWPFTKNMSSAESIMYVNDQLFLNPLEVLLGATIVAWLLHRLVDPTWHFWKGRMFWPMMAFATFVVLGLLRGRLTGGDSRVAIFEGRAVVYLPVVYILITNLLVNRSQYRRLLWLAMVAVSIQSVFSLLHYSGLPDAERDELESLAEHSATVHMNALFIMAIAAWMLRCRPRVRWGFLLLLPPVVWAYILSQRRAAMIALFIGFVVVVVVVWHRRRRRFWFVVPVAFVLGLGFVLATWNASGALGLPAQAVKTVLFPEELGEADRSSDIYRQIEAYDLHFTIRSNPIFGYGFGQKFLRPWTLPDISFFEFWEYIPHNSVLWIWIKTGYFGFVAMLFLFARGLQLGIRSALKVRTDEHAVYVVGGVTYVVMFLVFAYVDIAWDMRSAVFLALAFALATDFERAIDDRKRVVQGVHTMQLQSVAQ